MMAAGDLAVDYPNLDPATIRRLEMLTEGPSLDLASLSASAARTLAAEYLTAMGNSWAPPKVDSSVHTLPHGHEMHVFRPQPPIADTAPLLIWLHGGGWVVGSSALHAPWGREIAARAGCVVADIDYPLAPENSCQQILEACVSTIRRCIAMFEPKLKGPRRRELLLGGESSGAHLALLADAALDLPEIAGVIAVNPIVDLRSDRLLYPSRQHFDDSRLMQPWDDFRWFIDTLIRDTDEVARYSPIVASGTRGSCRTHLIVGEYDVLRDEGQAFCRTHPGSTIEMIPGGIHNSLEFGCETVPANSFLEAISTATTSFSNPS